MVHYSNPENKGLLLRAGRENPLVPGPFSTCRRPPPPLGPPSLTPTHVHCPCFAKPRDEREGWGAEESIPDTLVKEEETLIIIPKQTGWVRTPTPKGSEL